MKFPCEKRQCSMHVTTVHTHCGRWGRKRPTNWKKSSSLRLESCVQTNPLCQKSGTTSEYAILTPPRNQVVVVFCQPDDQSIPCAPGGLRSSVPLANSTVCSILASSTSTCTYQSSCSLSPTKRFGEKRPQREMLPQSGSWNGGSPNHSPR